MSKLPELTLIPAGAGSGKTYRIKEQLADWVASGLVKPDRIAAVTFTESAASELRERIRATLMERGRLEDALQLDQSFISTIHGFGRRLLVEYAFEAGQCPNPRLLAEDEEQLLLRKAIARIDRIEPLSRRLHLFGYRYDFASGATDVEQFRQRILDAIHLLRIIGGDTDRKQRLRYGLDYVEKTYGPVDDADALTTALRRSAQALLDAYPECMRDYVNSNSAKTHVENDCRNLKLAARTDALNENWALWKSLQALKVFKKDNQLPADYQQLARAVMACAEALQYHPGPLADARQHTDVLFNSAWDALADYARNKRDKGIIDYTDMIDGAYQLLERSEVLAHLARRFDCLVIDEFQDTNPLQFSFLWKLHQAGVPALIVGDLKQSIMGFQSADPRLMASLLEQYPDRCVPLDGNWRSGAELMDVVNVFGGQLFGKAYQPLTPKAPFKSRLHPLEAICFEGKHITPAVQARHVAARIQAMLGDETIQVFDRYQQRQRPIRGEDIALLGLTHARLNMYAAALRELGIRVRLAQDGWFGSRVVQLAYYGLSYVADPQDRHAALYLTVTELGQDELTPAVNTLLHKESLCSPLLERLEAIARTQSDKTVDELVVETIEAMDLFDLTAVWPEAGQVRANLLRLVGEARDFVAADREALAGGGFYGSGLKTFLAWLPSRLNSREGDRQPDAMVHDEEAVQLVTWHAAKGREWPIVVVATLDWDLGGKLPGLDIQYTDFSDLDRILDHARLVFSPAFAASETQERFKTPLDESAAREALNLLYVAFTRAREQVIIEWPGNLATSTRHTFWHQLKAAARMELKANKLLIGDHTFDCRVIAADCNPPEAFANLSAGPVQPLHRLGRRALQPADIPDDLTPVFRIPSKLAGQEPAKPTPSIDTIEYGTALELALPSGAERGLLIHRALELLGQGVPSEKAREVMPQVLTDTDWDRICQMAETFMLYVQQTYQPTTLHLEVPVTAVAIDGSVIAGTIDLLTETADGLWVIDHKTDKPSDLQTTFSHYWPQLDCYARALAEGLGRQVCGIAIHWACLGLVSQVAGLQSGLK